MPKNASRAVIKDNKQTSDDYEARFKKIKYFWQIGIAQAIICFLLIISVWLLALVKELPQLVNAIVYAVAFFIGGFLKAKEGIEKTLADKRLNVELLMILAAVGSYVIGYWLEGAVLILIFSISGILESYTEEKSYSEINNLLKMQPNEATIVKDGNQEIICVEKLEIGDVVIIKAGEQIPIDGVIIDGRSLVDESSLTGESIPTLKSSGSNAFAGTINLNGVLMLEVSIKSNETVFNRVLQVVKNAQKMKVPTQIFIERFENTYVKLVLLMVLALMFGTPLFFGWSYSEAFYRSMVLMAVASPCAVVASITPAILVAISNGAKNGILIKGGIHLERLGTIKVLAFDKTGTLTVGKPSVTDIICTPNIEKNNFLRIVATIEKHSTHPLAQSVVKHALTEGVKLGTPKDVKNVIGKGVSGFVDNNFYRIGNKDMIEGKLCSNYLFNAINNLVGEGKTIVYVGDEEKVIGIIALLDRSRKQAKQMIAQLRKQNILAVMITGDTEKVASEIAKENEITKYYASCFPEQKIEIIRQLIEKYNYVGMVGDGINDAPALATASVGIAMGGGTDIALETADIVLMRDDLSCITKSILLSKRLKRIILQNLIFSVAVIILLVCLNVFRLLQLPLGVIGHETSTLLVIFNSLRLLK